MTQLFTNNAGSTLAAGITAASTSVTLATGDGAKFPTLGAGDDFLLTVYQRPGTIEQNHEIMLVTARSGDTLTVVRAQEGTTAKAFNLGDFAELRLTAGSILPARAGALTGALNEATPPTLASSATVLVGSAKANTVYISGTTTINAFDSAPAGAKRRTLFQGALTLTHNTAALTMIGGANIVTAAGDACEWISTGGGKWTMISYERASGDILGTASIAHGGTGAQDAATARTNLGVPGLTSPTINNSLTISAPSTEAQHTLASGTGGKYTRFFYRTTDDNFGVYLFDGTSGATRLRFIGLTGTVALAEGGGNVVIGAAAEFSTEKLQVSGAVKATGGFVGNVTGNVSGSAGKLATAQNINGVAFDGTGPITIADATKLALSGHVGQLNNGRSWVLTSANLNTCSTAGFYCGNSMPNAPDTGWWYVLIESHDNTAGAAGWTKQTATAYGSGNSYPAGTVFVRMQTGATTWSAWMRLGYAAGDSTLDHAAKNVNASGIVSAANGFTTPTYSNNARNPIWRFGNADGYGLSYFQNTAGIGNLDTIGLHYGTATATSSPFQFISNGMFNAASQITAQLGGDGQVFIGENSHGNIEIGKQGRSAAGTPFIDFHSSAGSPDFDVRIIASGGGSAAAGTGTLNIVAGAFTCNGVAVLTSNSTRDWTQITSKPTTLEGLGLSNLQRAQLPTSANLKDYTTSGFYRYPDAAAGYAAPWNYGNFVVINGGGDTFGQIYVDYSSGAMASRGGVINGGQSVWRVATPTDGAGANGTWGINIYGNAGNTSSCTNAANASHTWNAQQYFNTNRNGSAVTTSNSASGGIIVQDGNGGPAFMSFLRGGDYAVNFGLDTDHVVRLGGWSAGAMFHWNMPTGDFTATGNVVAYSDPSLKHNWRDLPADFIERWARIQHGTYDRLDMAATQVGLNAADVAEILPDAVMRDAQDLLSLNYGGAAGVATVALAKEVVALRDIVTRQARLIETLFEKVGA